jgi:hypothetical protein
MDNEHKSNKPYSKGLEVALVTVALISMKF